MNRRTSWGIVAGGLAIALLVALLSPLASSAPDGLERVARSLGFSGLAQKPLYTILPDYTIPGIGNKAISSIISGMVGVLLVFGLSLGLAFLMKHKSQKKTPHQPQQ